MDMVIRVDGRFIRLSPHNREQYRDATGPIVRVQSTGFYYVPDPDGIDMRDVTDAWNANPPR